MRTLSFRNNGRGFTLLELVIVIAIVGILASLALASYANIRRQAKLDLAFDGLVTMIKEQSSKAKSGRLQNGSQLSCYGFSIEKKQDATSVQTFSMPYISISQNQADVCDPAKKAVLVSSFLEDVVVKDITLNGRALDQAEVTFKPPFGKAFAASGTPLADIFTEMTVLLGYPGSNDDRKLRYDAVTGNVTRVLLRNI